MRKKLIDAGIEIKEQSRDQHNDLRKKIIDLKMRGRSFQGIADILNLWKIPTRSGEGIWYAKTVRELLTLDE